MNIADSFQTLSLVYLQPKTQIFVELFLITVILHTQKGSQGQRHEQSLLNIFMTVKDIPELVRGLQYFLRKVVKRTEVASNKQDKATLNWACVLIGDALAAIVSAGLAKT